VERGSWAKKRVDGGRRGRKKSIRRACGRMSAVSVMVLKQER
jgi:hypothetical protein